MPVLVAAPPLDPRFGGDVPGRPLNGGVLWATLGGVTFGQVDEFGVRVHLALLTGWFSPPSSTGTVEQRAAADGGWLLPAYTAPRSVALVARLFGTSWAHLDASLARIAEAVPLAALSTLTVGNTETDEILQALIRQDQDVLTERDGAYAQVSISLVAPDPRRYGVDEVTASTGLPASTGGIRLPTRLPARIVATIAAGALTVTNAGNMATSPVLTVVGPCPPFTITHLRSGRTLRYHQPVPAGRTLVLDTAARTAREDGTAARAITGAWFDYPPGVNTLAFSAATFDPGARLVSVHHDAWK